MTHQAGGLKQVACVPVHLLRSTGQNPQMPQQQRLPLQERRLVARAASRNALACKTTKRVAERCAGRLSSPGFQPKQHSLSAGRLLARI